eukprot:11184959-Lingulodinium_polyedra.AAC.1
MTRAFPARASAHAAEAWAARTALEILPHDACPDGSVLRSGDNLGAAKYCAGAGRLTEPSLQSILDANL